MAAKQLKTVLFAEVSGRDEYVRAAGRVIGWNGISDCVNSLQQTARSSGGKVVKVIGPELMMLFESPDAAANAASRMHAAVNSLPTVGGALSVKVGYHAGPVIEGSDDLLGDTVKQVAALLRQAHAGETITTPQTARLLNPSYSGQVTVPGSAGGIHRARAAHAAPHLWKRIRHMRTRQPHRPRRPRPRLRIGDTPPPSHRAGTAQSSSRRTDSRCAITAAWAPSSPMKAARRSSSLTDRKSRSARTAGFRRLCARVRFATARVHWSIALVGRYRSRVLSIRPRLTERSARPRPGLCAIGPLGGEQPRQRGPRGPQSAHHVRNSAAATCRYR